MEEIKETKNEIRSDMIKTINGLPEADLKNKTNQIYNRLFEFANFLESKIVLLYLNKVGEVDTNTILENCHRFNKILVLPAFDAEKFEMRLLKIDHIKKDLVPGVRGIPEPNPNHCKEVPIDCLDIAIIPGIVFDEKGGRIGSGEGYYDRLIPKLPITTRKVALAFECQIYPQVPTESHDRYVDIIITEDRIIYKI
jgi:5-formyltetrahydrofolate cyclo-ligase